MKETPEWTKIIVGDILRFTRTVSGIRTNPILALKALREAIALLVISSIAHFGVSLMPFLAVHVYFYR